MKFYFFIIKGLLAIGIHNDVVNILNKFPKLKAKKEITKNEFIDVLTSEYQEKLDVAKK